MGEKHKPGEIAKESGQYPIQGPRGVKTDKERMVVKGEPFPPTPKKGKRMGRLIRPSTKLQPILRNR